MSKTDKSANTKITKTLAVKLSPEERGDLAVEIAKHVEAYDDLEAEKKRVTKDLSKRMKEQRAAISAKAKAQLTGELDREIECEEIKDFDRNEIVTRRIDNGETVGSRPMTGDERQREMDFPGGDEDDDSDDDDDDDGEAAAIARLPEVTPSAGAAKVRGKH